MLRRIKSMANHTFYKFICKNVKNYSKNPLFLLPSQYTIYGGCFQPQIQHKVKIGSPLYANMTWIKEPI